MAAVTKGGKASAQLPTGEVRNFIQDGDQVKERGRGVADGRVSIGFGEAAGQVRPASKMCIDGDRSQSLALGKEGLSRAGFLLRGRSAVSLFGDAKILEGRQLHLQMLDSDASFLSEKAVSYLSRGTILVAAPLTDVTLTLPEPGLNPSPATMP